MGKARKYPCKIEKVTEAQVIQKLNHLLEKIIAENVGFVFVHEESGKACYLLPEAEENEKYEFRG